MRTRHTRGSVAAAVAITALLAACAPQPALVEVAAPTPGPTSVSVSTPDATVPAAPAPAPESVAFLSTVDGDTIETTAGRVRIIGIDTPERGECGEDRSSAAISSVLAPGDAVTLDLPAGQNDQDRYGRLLRYVATPAGVDLGLLQLQAGNAVARYDSRDGYPAHPREAAYRAAQLASLSDEGAVVAVSCAVAAVAPAAPATDRWWEEYSSCTKLKKNDVGHPTGPFRRDDPAQAEQYEWFAHGTGNHGDGDDDGLACE